MRDLDAKRTYNREWELKNRDKRNAQQRARYPKHAEDRRKRSSEYHHANRDRLLPLMRARNQSEHGRALMWKRRGLPQPTRSAPKRCELCDGPPTGNGKKLHNEHDHETGVFRGWLCSKCNIAIGLLNESPELCEAAALYLRRAKCN